MEICGEDGEWDNDRVVGSNMGSRSHRLREIRDRVGDWSENRKKDGEDTSKEREKRKMKVKYDFGVIKELGVIKGNVERTMVRWYIMNIIMDKVKVISSMCCNEIMVKNHDLTNNDEKIMWEK